MPAAAVNGKTVGPEILCPHCLAVGSLVYTSRWVARGSRWPGRGGIEDRQTPVPLCRCAVCKHCFRVLPVEMAPYKSYTRPVIETGCAAHTARKEAVASLRKTVKRMGRGHPDHSCLHGWLAGLGARALGRLDRGAGTAPVGALIAESAKRLQPDLPTWWTSRLSEKSGHLIAPSKYRSPQRRDQLEACGRLFDTAQRLFPESVYPWTEWERWLQSRFHVTAWGFPARFIRTTIQHHDPHRLAITSALSFREPKRRKEGKIHGARSPP